MDSISDPIARPLSTAPAGVYTGKRISISNNQSLDVIALVDGKGNLRISSLDGSELYAGVYTTNGSNLTIAALRYTPTPPSTDPASDATTAAAATTPSTPPAQTTETVNASGSFDTSNNLQIVYSTADDLGQFQLSYQTKQYETRSNLASLAGSWGAKDAYGFPVVRFTIDNSGNVFGKDNQTACVYTGALAIIDIHYNLYTLSLSRQCGAVTLDSYGLATLLTPTSGDPELISITAASAIATSATSTAPAVAILLDLNPL